MTINSDPIKTLGSWPQIRLTALYSMEMEVPAAPYPDCNRGPPPCPSEVGGKWVDGTLDSTSCGLVEVPLSSDRAPHAGAPVSTEVLFPHSEFGKGILGSSDPE